MSTAFPHLHRTVPFQEERTSFPQRHSGPVHTWENLWRKRWKGGSRKAALSVVIRGTMGYTFLAAVPCLLAFFPIRKLVGDTPGTAGPHLFSVPGRTAALTGAVRQGTVLRSGREPDRIPVGNRTTFWEGRQDAGLTEIESSLDEIVAGDSDEFYTAILPDKRMYGGYGERVLCPRLTEPVVEKRI